MGFWLYFFVKGPPAFIGSWRQFWELSESRPEGFPADFLPISSRNKTKL